MRHPVSCIICGSQIMDPDWRRPFRTGKSATRQKREHMFAQPNHMVVLIDGQILTPQTTVYAEGSPQEARFSGPGVIRPDGAFFASKESDSAAVTNLVDISLMRTHFPSTTAGRSTWGYPFHEACWTILHWVRRYYGYGPPGTVNAQSLFDLCRSFPVQKGMVNWGHDYDGSATYVDEPSGLTPGEESWFRFGWFDPENGSIDPGTETNGALHIPWLRQLFEAQPQDVLPDLTEVASQRYTASASVGYYDAFSRLPTEILQLILTHLPTPDVRNLRLACRFYAELQLHGAFWKSRFHPGHEFDFVVEGLTDQSSLASGRWKAIYSVVKSQCRHPQFVNRRRIWRLATSLAQVLWRATITECAGIPADTPLHSEDPILGADVRWNTACRAPRPLDQHFLYGSRSLYQRAMTVPDRATALSVSTVDVFGRRYVSGLRFQQEDGECLDLGYRHADSEVLLFRCERGRPGIAGFCVAQDQRGVRGLCVITDTGALSDWAGRCRGIPKRRLVPSAGGCDIVKGLLGGFDVSILHPWNGRCSPL